MKTHNAGFIRFVPMLLIAVALMGLVGYVSVTRLKDKVVLGETSDVNENDLKVEESSLNDVEDLSLDELEDQGLEKEDSSASSPVATKSPTYTPPAYVPNQPQIEKQESGFFGFFNQLLKQLESVLRGLR